MAILSLNFACQKNSTNSVGGDGVQAVTPAPIVPNGNCLSYQNIYQSGAGQNCYYDYGRHSGFGNYLYAPNQGRFNFQNGFCGCQNNLRPTFNNQWGLGCVDNSFVQSANNYFTPSFYWDSSNTQWYNVPQLPAAQPFDGSCYRDAVLACDSAVPNSCGVGALCVAINGHRIGICQFNNYNNYGTGNGYGYGSGYGYGNGQGYGHPRNGGRLPHR